MDTSTFLRNVWEDKRGKAVGATQSTFGVTITVDAETPVTSHGISYCLLKTLSSNPHLGLEWSRSWGRTKVCVHPRKSLSASFTIKGSSEEKSAAILKTSESLWPGEFVNETENEGAYLIVLNGSHQLSLEGCILQVERMVDELVWVNYLKEQDHATMTDEVAIYESVVKAILGRGIRIETSSEDLIIALARKDPNLKIRMYGDVKHLGTVPHVIGMARVGFDLSSSRHGKLPMPPQLVTHTNITDGTPRPGFIVAAGITLAKQMHLGHALTLVTAETVRRACLSAHPLIIESNDIGPRVDQTFALIARRHNVDVVNVASLISSGAIMTAEVLSAYQARCDEPVPVPDPANWRPGRLKTLETLSEMVLKEAGLNVDIVADSDCLDEFSELRRNIGVGWSAFGFSYVRYGHGSYRGLIVLEQQGLPTASAMRASVALNQLYGRDVGTLVYVDAGMSVKTASRLVSLFDPALKIVPMPGAGIGYQGAIESGTKGDLPSVEDTLELLNVPGSQFYGALSVLANTRWVTENTKEPHDNRDFYDYHDYQSLIADVKMALEELDETRQRLDILHLALGRQSVPNSNSAPIDTHKLVGAVELSQHLLSGISPAYVLQTKLWKLEAPIRNYRNWLLHSCSGVGKGSDAMLLRVLASRPSSWKCFLQLMADQGVIGRPQTKDHHKPTTSLISILAQAGYKDDDLVKIAERYLSGDLKLKRRVAEPWRLIECLTVINTDNLSALPLVTQAILNEGLFVAERLLQIYP